MIDHARELLSRALAGEGVAQADDGFPAQDDGAPPQYFGHYWDEVHEKDVRPGREHEGGVEESPRAANEPGEPDPRNAPNPEIDLNMCGPAGAEARETLTIYRPGLHFEPGAARIPMAVRGSSSILLCGGILMS